MVNGNGKTGRPKKPIDWKEAEKLCALQCSQLEIADWFHISVDTLERRLKEEQNKSFAEFFTLHRVQGKIALRRNLFRLSERYPQAAIFLAKNILGMSDRQEFTGEGGGPIKTEINIIVQDKNTGKLMSDLLGNITERTRKLVLGNQTDKKPD